MAATPELRTEICPHAAPPEVCSEQESRFDGMIWHCADVPVYSCGN
jgi:hypothetical protein